MMRELQAAFARWESPARLACYNTLTLNLRDQSAAAVGSLATRRAAASGDWVN
jgi:hypothetical protein